MIAGFPTHLIATLCCTFDGAPLALAANGELSPDGGHVRRGAVTCSRCFKSFSIDDGILNLIDDSALDDESRHEQTRRNAWALETNRGGGPAWYENEDNAMEMEPTLEALALRPDDTILELGCGDGRYTSLLTGRRRHVVACDFSSESLRVLAGRLDHATNVGLVLGDISTLKVTAGAFHLIFSTLVSNLPTREHRNALYRLAATAMDPDGRLVFSTHHHGIRQRLQRKPKSGRYDDGGIYRYNFSVRECRDELRPHFGAIKANPIHIYFPFARRLHLPLVATSRFFEPIPVFNKLGDLVLCSAARPKATATDS